MLAKKKSLMSLLWVMLFDHTSLNITFPILTLLFFDSQTRFFPADTSYTMRSMYYGICVAIPHIVNIVMAPILSALSDEVGRRKILLIATAGAFLFAVIAAFGILSGILSVFFLARIIQGAFSRTNPIAQAVIGDISPADKKILYMGYLQFVISVGAFIGPVIGGYFAKQFLFAEFNFSLPYWIGALLAAISFLLTYFIFQETCELKQKASWTYLNPHSLKQMIKNPEVFLISSILFLSQISWSLYYQFMPPILKITRHFDAKELGLFVGLIALWLAVATSVGIKWLQKFFKMRQILFISLNSILIGLLLTIFASYLKFSLLTWIAALPTAAGDVIAYSCLTAWYSNVVKKNEQGQVMGICFIIIAIIWSLTGLAGGMLMSINPLLPTLVAPLGIVGAIVLLSRYLKLD